MQTCSCPFHEGIYGHQLQKQWIWCMFVGASFYKCWVENQLDATECFIAHIICSTCFGHLHAHHQELEAILVLLLHMVCNASVPGGRWWGAGQQAMRPGWQKLFDWLYLRLYSIQRCKDYCIINWWSNNFRHPGHTACCPAPDRRPPPTKALHTTCSNNASIVSSSWWWAHMCPIHVQQIISAIKNSVASSWFSCLGLYSHVSQSGKM